MESKTVIPSVVPISLSYGTYVTTEDYGKLYNEHEKLRDEYLRVLEENTKLKEEINSYRGDNNE